MSWNASGPVVDVNDYTQLLYTPPYDTLSDDPRAQADFLLDVVTEAYNSGVVEGENTVNIGGHTDPDNPSNKSLFMSIGPVVRTEGAGDMEIG